MLRAHGVTDQGSTRASNEDWFAVDEELQLLVVADGLGGQNAGEIASRLAVDSLLGFVRESRGTKEPRPPDAIGLSDKRWPFGFDPSLSEAGNRVRTGICLANAHILEMSMTADEYSGMGTTLVVALVEDGRLSVGYVGDSRLYLRGADGLRQVTRDDSWILAVLDQNPGIDPEVIRQHPMRNALTNVVGAGTGIEVHIVEEMLTGGELLLLSTDGVHGVLDNGWLDRLLTETDDISEMAAGLVATAITRGSRDNCTAVVARYSSE